MSCPLHGEVWCTCPMLQPRTDREEIGRLKARVALMEARIERLEELLGKTHHGHLLTEEQTG